MEVISCFLTTVFLRLGCSQKTVKNGQLFFKHLSFQVVRHLRYLYFAIMDNHRICYLIWELNDNSRNFKQNQCFSLDVPYACNTLLHYSYLYFLVIDVAGIPHHFFFNVLFLYLIYRKITKFVKLPRKTWVINLM